jgi:hypothetical protein
LIEDLDVVCPDSMSGSTGMNDSFCCPAVRSTLVGEKFLITVCSDQEHRDRCGSVVVEHDLGSNALTGARHSLSVWVNVHVGDMPEVTALRPAISAKNKKIPTLVGR